MQLRYFITILPLVINLFMYSQVDTVCNAKVNIEFESVVSQKENEEGVKNFEEDKSIEEDNDESVDVIKSSIKKEIYDTPINLKVLDDNTNIRSGPGKSYDIIGVFSKGEIVKGYSIINNWVKISENNEEYIFRDLLNEVESDKLSESVDEKFSFSSSFFSSFFLVLAVLIFFSFGRTKKDARYSSGVRVLSKGFDFGGPISVIVLSLIIALSYTLFKWITS